MTRRQRRGSLYASGSLILLFSHRCFVFTFMFIQWFPVQIISGPRGGYIHKHECVTRSQDRINLQPCTWNRGQLTFAFSPNWLRISGERPRNGCISGPHKSPIAKWWMDKLIWICVWVWWRCCVAAGWVSIVGAKGCSFRSQEGGHQRGDLYSCGQVESKTDDIRGGGEWLCAGARSRRILHSPFAVLYWSSYTAYSPERMPLAMLFPFTIISHRHLSDYGGLFLSLLIR